MREDQFGRDFGEPFLPSNRSRQLIAPGSPVNQTLLRARERLVSAIPVQSPTRREGSKNDETAIDLTDPDILKSISQPKASDLWYFFNLLDDTSPKDVNDPSKVTLDLITRLAISPVKTVIGGTNASNIRFRVRTFPIDYEAIQKGNPSTKGITFQDTGGNNLAVSIDFVIGDPASVLNTSLVGDVSGELQGVSQGTKLLPPTPHENGADEIVLTRFFYLHDESVVIIPPSQTTKFKPFYTIRKLITENQTYPVPGEFVGLAARAFPNHAWFFQDTNPFLFCGNWFETTYYSSGIISAIKPTGDIDRGDEYDVKIKGKTFLNVKASDYFPYKIGDRVALLKGLDLKENFHEENLVDAADWRIIPISFY